MTEYIMGLWIYWYFHKNTFCVFVRVTSVSSDYIDYIVLWMLVYLNSVVYAGIGQPFRLKFIE